MTTKTVSTKIGRLVQENATYQRLNYELTQIQQTIDEIIADIQKKCQHTEFNLSHSGNYQYGQGRDLLEKTCKDCGLEFRKPKGMSWQICNKCWSQMVDDGHRQEGEDRVHHYHCPNCGHKERHT
jgi:DNA-directed RNA polymerase subunit RPC12/RpoP